MTQLKRYTTSHGTMCDAAEVADLEIKHKELKIASAELVFLLGMTRIKGSEHELHELAVSCNKVLQLILKAKGGTIE